MKFGFRWSIAHFYTKNRLILQKTPFFCLFAFFILMQFCFTPYIRLLAFGVIHQAVIKKGSLVESCIRFFHNHRALPYRKAVILGAIRYHYTSMPKLPQYTSIASEAFNLYLDQQIDLETLIGRLRDMEWQVLSDADEKEDELPQSDAKVWFRFFAEDPMQTTINEIEQDLSNPTHPSAQILLRGIAYGLNANELEVHIS